jgi:hypothetical protein
MSYSICNVMKEAGIENILRWLPFKLDEEDVGCRLSNKMIRPTTIPQTLEELIIEHAVAREALRLGLQHHKSIATRLRGIRIQRTFESMFNQEIAESYIDMLRIPIMAGTGGLLSHAPRRIQSMYILSDAFQPEGITWLFQDSVFMMPHLGVLSTVYPEAAWQIFDKDCLVRLGTVIAPRGTAQEGQEVMTVKMKMPDGATREETVKFGDLLHVALPEGTEAEVTVDPARTFDMGLGPDKLVEGKAMGGKAGVILDGRGRPIQLPEDDEKRKESLLKWFKAVELYDPEKLKEI